MQVYRLTRKRYAGSLSGKGAALYPGRWNREGQEIIYTAMSRSLALVEILVHLPRSIIPHDIQLQTIHIPETLSVHMITPDYLLPGWDRVPPGPESQRYGSILLKDNLLVQAPSAIVQDEWNLLINPHLPGFSQIVLHSEDAFPLDARLFRLS